MGEVQRVEDGQVVLRYSHPSGVWNDDPDTYSLAELTRVDFGEGYLEALAIVGDDDEG